MGCATIMLELRRSAWRKPFIDIVARRSDWQNEERAAKPGGLGLAGGLDRLERQLPVLTAGWGVHQ
jgi:hypothetical protein